MRSMYHYVTNYLAQMARYECDMWVYVNSFLAKQGEDLQEYNREDLDYIYIATHRIFRHGIICNRVTIENLRCGGNKW